MSGLAPIKDSSAEPVPGCDALARYLEESARLFGLPQLTLGILAGGQEPERYEISPDEAPRRVYKAGSLTKIVTALAVLRSAETGVLKLTDPVGRHLPWFDSARGGGGAGSTTVQDLLLHVGRLPRGRFLDHDPSEDEIRCELEESGGLPAALPAKAVVYSNLGYILLGFIVGRANRESYASFVQRTVFEPLGMNDSGFGRPRREGEMAQPHRLSYFLPASLTPFDQEPTVLRDGPAAAFDMYSTVDDLTRLHACLLNRGWHEGRRIWTAQTVAALAETTWPIDARLGTGLGFRRMKAYGGDMWFENGEHFGHSASMLLLPERQIALTALANRGSAALELASVLSTVVRYLVNSRDPKELDHHYRGYKDVVGTYTSEDGTTLRITEVGGVLSVARDTEPAGPLVYKGQGCFLKREGALGQYIVQLDPRVGRVSGLCLGPHYFRKGIVPPERVHRRHAAITGIYRNATVGRIALFERGGGLILAYSPGKEARLEERAAGGFVQTDGPFPGEVVAIDPSSRHLTLGGLTFGKTEVGY